MSPGNRAVDLLVDALEKELRPLTAIPGRPPQAPGDRTRDAKLLEGTYERDDQELDEAPIYEADTYRTARMVAPEVPRSLWRAAWDAVRGWFRTKPDEVGFRTDD